MRTFGLVGYPLSHSFSQKYFSDKFKRKNISDSEFINFPLEDINKLSALLALTALSFSGKGKDAKLEVLLKEAGLEVAEIAKVLGKNEQAVRKMIMRAK